MKATEFGERVLRKVCLAAIIGLPAMSACFAQGSGTTAVLGGKVVDAQGRGIRSARVTVISDRTDGRWEEPTNSAGIWRVEALVAGFYHFQVSAPGFKTLNRSSIELQIADQKFVDVTLSVGAQVEEVTVTDTTPLVDTTAAVSGTVLTNAQINEIPTESNTPLALVGLTPGLAQGSGLNNTAHLWSNATFQEISANGSSANGTTSSLNVTLDGGTNTFGSGGVAYLPPSDAISEVRVATNAYDTSIGRASSGTISLSMKSGGPAVHGVLYEINQNSLLDANLQQNSGTHTAKPPVHFNEYGGTVGGPIFIPKLYDGRKKQTFFFFNFDGIRNTVPTSAGYFSLPTAAERQGDFSQSFTTATIAGVTKTYPIIPYDPTTINTVTGNRTPFSGAIIPTARISSVAKSILALMPLPNHAHTAAGTDTNNYSYNYIKADKFAGWGLRGDHSWNNNNHSFAAFRYNNFTEDSYYFGAHNPSNVLNGYIQARNNYGLTINHAWAIKPTLVLNLTGNASTHKTGLSSPGVGADPTAYGFSQALAQAQLLKGLPQISGVGFTVGTTNNSLTNDYLYEGTVTLTQTYKSHTLAYGAEYLLQQESGISNPGGAGSFAFSSIWTTLNPNTTAGAGIGSTQASFLLGLPTSGSLSNNASSFWSQPFVGFYVQDSWRTTSKLTLDFGLRWDAQLALKERFNRFFSHYDPNANIAPVTNYALPNYASLIGSTSANTGVQLLQQYGPAAGALQANGAILYAGTNGTSSAVSKTLYKYFQPRVGFAYRVHRDTVIRGGFGRFVQANFNTGNANQLGYTAQTPFTATTDNYYTPASTLDNPFSGGLVPVTGNASGILTSVGSVGSYTNPNVPRLYTDEASVHLQQQVGTYLFEIGGTLNLTRGIEVAYDANQPSLPAWLAAYGPQFDASGRPVDTLSANTQVTNPFKGAPYITSTLDTTSTIAANQLLRPHPLLSSLTDYEFNGRSTYYALQTKIEKRYAHGLGLLTNFTWSKSLSEDAYYTAPAISQKLKRTLDSGDQRFQFILNPTYDLPFGRGQILAGHVNRLVDTVIGGWKLSGVLTMISGTPIVLPTDSSSVLFEGHDPVLASGKTKQKWFDTSKFEAFPTINTTVAQLGTYPAWANLSSLPGYSWSPTTTTDPAKNGVYNDYHTRSSNYSTTFGDIRNPSLGNVDIGLRKTFALYSATRFELRVDAFNALNHPRFGSVNTTPGATYFGYLSGSPNPTAINNPRTVQIEGKLYY